MTMKRNKLNRSTRFVYKSRCTEHYNEIEDEEWEAEDEPDEEEYLKYRRLTPNQRAQITRRLTLLHHLHDELTQGSGKTAIAKMYIRLLANVLMKTDPQLMYDYKDKFTAEEPKVKSPPRVQSPDRSKKSSTPWRTVHRES